MIDNHIVFIFLIEPRSWNKVIPDPFITKVKKKEKARKYYDEILFKT